MNKLLIVKTGAAGDVVRTTTLLRLFSDWEVDWLTAKENRQLLEGAQIRCLMDDPSELSNEARYDLVISLEDDTEFVRNVFSRITFEKVFGSHLNKDGSLVYTDDATEWFDMSLISRFGRKEADAIKLRNRKSYQEMIFKGLGHTFSGEEYVIPDQLPETGLRGDIAVSPKAGARWPIKNWPYFDKLIEGLSQNYTVNILPMRKSLLEHTADIRGHRFLISGDSLPMHIALGLRIPSVAIFTCTSPWEIYDYGLLTKIIAPTLDRYFYSREFVPEAVTSLSYDDVHRIVADCLVRFRI